MYIMRWRTKKLIIWIIALIGLIILRECKHAEREYNLKKQIIEMEYKINEAYSDGFHECLEKLGE